MDTKRASLERVFWTDYTAFVSILLILIVWGVIAFLQYMQRIPVAPGFVYAAVAATPLGIAVFAWRARLIGSAFDDGWEVDGHIVDVSFFRDRGRVTYVYEIQGQRYQAGNTVMRHRLTRDLIRGQKVAIMASKDKPGVAFIRDIYI